MSAAPTASIGGGGGGGGSSNFTGLTDTPSSYISQGNKLLAVNSAENAVEFITAPSGDFVGLTDTPSSFSGEAGKVPAVNTGETALEFVNMPAMTEGAFPGIIATEDVLSSDLNLTGSYQDITSVTVDCIEDETVLMFFDCYCDDAASTNWENIAFRVLVDGGVHAVTGRNQKFDTSFQYDSNNVSIHISVALTSGPHTIKVQALTNGATSTGRIRQARETITQFRGAGINGVETYEDTITVDKTVTAVYPSYETAGHSVTFNTLEGEQVEVKFIGSIIGVGAATNAIIGYRIDGGSVEETWQHTTSSATRDQATFSIMTPALSAGQHTIEIMASHGTANNYIIEKDSDLGIASLLQVIRFKAFAIGAGSIITTDTLSANKSITSTHPTYEDTGLSIDITVIDGETFLLGLKAAVNATNFGGASWAYKVDSGSDIPLNYSSFYGFNAHHNVSFAVPISGLSSGPHTITLRAAKVTNNYTISYDTGNIGTPTFYAVQHRGGLIPVQDDGLDIVDKPSALNFTGAGVTVTDVNGTATVAIPGGGGGSAIAVEDEGTPLTADVTKFNFAGAGVTVTEPVADEMLVTIPGGGGNFLSLTDTPSSFSGEAGKIARVNDAESALEFIIQPDGSLGGYQEMLVEDFVGGSNSNTSYAAIDAIGQQTFTTPVSGEHIFTFTTGGYASGGAVTVKTRLVLDKGTGSEQILGDSDSWTTHYTVSPSARGNPTYIGIANLPAGTHTMDLEVKVSANAWARSVNDTTTCLVLAQGSGINGLEVVEQKLGSNVSVTTTTPSWQDATGMSLTFNTLEGEYVQLAASLQFSATASGGMGFAYTIDGGSELPLAAQSTPGGYNEEAHSTKMIGPFSAGQHTLQLRVNRFNSNAHTLLTDNLDIGRETRIAIVRFKSAGIGAGTIVKTATQTGSWTQTTASTYEDVPELTLDITTIENEQVELITLGSVWGTAAGTVGLQVRFSVDGTTFSPYTYDADTYATPSYRRGINHSWVTPPLTAGTHTVKVQAYKNGTTTNRWSSGNILQSIQYRGGLIPVKDDDVAIVEKPSALNFVGALVEADGTEAKVTFPNAALGGYHEELVYAPSGAIVETSGTFVDIAGMANQTFTTPISGIHEITVHAMHFADPAFVGNGNADAEIRLLIDDVTAVDDNFFTQAIILAGGVTSWQGFSHTFLVNLGAGQHTIRPQWRDGGAAVDPAMNVGREWHINIQGQGSGINGLEVTEVNISSPVVVTAINPAWTATGYILTVNALEGERILLSLNGNGSTSTSGVVIATGYRQDGVTDVYIQGEHHQGGSGAGNTGFAMWTAPLTAGQHTFELLCNKASTGQWTLNSSADSFFRATRFKSFGIGAGSIVTEAALTSNFTLTATSLVYEDVPNLSVDINTIEDERVQVIFNGDGYADDSGSSGWILIAYTIDGGVEQLLSYERADFPEVVNLNASVMTEPLTSGPHTIKIRAARQVAGGTYNPSLQQSNFKGLQVVQYRGGLIPVQDDGVEIVDKPSALDFAGAGVTVTQSGTKALVTIPGGGGGSAIEVEDEGTPLTTDVTKFNFAGAGVTVTEPVADEMLVTIPGGSSNFLSLTDTPANFTDDAGKILRVNDAEDALEFIDTPTAALGGYLEHFTYSGSSTTLSSATYVDLPGCVNQSFTTPVSGPHKFVLAMNGVYHAGSSGGTGILAGVNIDGAEYDLSSTSLSATNYGYKSYTFIGQVDLAAGAHTVRPIWRRTSGTNTPKTDSATHFLSISSQGSGINGLEVVENQLSSNWTQTAVATWEDTGLEVTINTLEGERVQVNALGTVWGAASGALHVQWMFQIDGTTDSPMWYHNDASGAFRFPIDLNWMTPALSAGSHTIKLRQAKVSGSQNLTINANSTTLQATRFKSAGIGAGTIVSSSGYLSSAKSITSSHPTYEDTGIDVTFTTIADEEVTYSFVGSALKDAAGAGGFYLAYKLDSDADVPVLLQSEDGNNHRSNISFTLPITIATAGSHTIKLRAARDAGGTWTLPVTATSPAGSAQQIAKVTQFRGGLIPVLDDSVEIIDKPSALDFAGAGVTVTQSGTKALITIPGTGGGSGRREVWQIEDGDVPPVSSRIGTDLNFATARKFSATVNNDIVFQAPVPDNRAASTDVIITLKYVTSNSDAGNVKLDLDYVVADLAVDIDPASADANLTSTFAPGTGAETHRSVTFTVANADIASNDTT
jgi:hypothetical protein